MKNFVKTLIIMLSIFCIAWTQQSFAQDTTVKKARYTLLKPYKDNLFGYKSIVYQEFDKKYTVFPYSQKVDLEQRDSIPEKRARDEYFDTTEVEKYRVDKTFTYQGKKITFTETTKAGNWLAKEDVQYLVIYIHGLNGNRTWGTNDFSFWWNFNRIQNLMLENNGSYIATEFSDFNRRGMLEVRELILSKRKEYPKARVFVACGSSGGAICWGLASDVQGNRLIHGLLILGSSSGYDWFNNSSLSFQRKRLLPIYIAHGEKDRVIWLAWQKKFFSQILAKNKDYPIRMHVFTNWTHGTPIRMFDWKTVLNWMIKNS